MIPVNEVEPILEMNSENMSKRSNYEEDAENVKKDEIITTPVSQVKQDQEEASVEMATETKSEKLNFEDDTLKKEIIPVISKNEKKADEVEIVPEIVKTCSVCDEIFNNEHKCRNNQAKSVIRKDSKN